MPVRRPKADRRASRFGRTRAETRTAGPSAMGPSDTAPNAAPTPIKIHRQNHIQLLVPWG
jgi:hypothetical protein